MAGRDHQQVGRTIGIAELVITQTAKQVQPVVYPPGPRQFPQAACLGLVGIAAVPQFHRLERARGGRKMKQA